MAAELGDGEISPAEEGLPGSQEHQPPPSNYWVSEEPSLPVSGTCAAL